MILLDTNVVSAVMAPSPPPSVVDWLNAQDSFTLHVSTITLAEIGFGLFVLPDGRRRRTLLDRFQKFISRGFEERILSFDPDAARVYPEVMGHRRSHGRPMSALDGQIASIGRARGLAIATRNVRDFEDCGVALINPFAGR